MKLEIQNSRDHFTREFFETLDAAKIIFPKHFDLLKEIELIFEIYAAGNPEKFEKACREAAIIEKFQAFQK